MNAVVVQCLSTIVLCLGCYQFSFIMVWPSYASTMLRNSTILDEPLTDTHIALLGSLPMLGCLVSTIIGGGIWDKLGRRYTMVLGALFFVVAWTIIERSHSINLILAARFIDGFGGGLILALGTITVAEISTPNIRGVITSIPTLLFNMGSIVSYICGWLCSYHVINLVNLCVSVVTVCGCLMVKESPVFLVMKGKEKDALDSLRFYRGSAASEQDLMDELANIKNLVGGPYELAPTVENSTANEKTELAKLEHNPTSRGPERRSAWVLLFTTPVYRRAFFTVLFLFIGLVFMGTMGIYAYAGMFFMEAVPSLSSHVCSILLGLSNTAGSVVSMSITDRLGRRILLISSSAMVFGCLLTLACVLNWSLGPAWLVPALMLFSCFCLQVGAAPVPAILLGEYFTPEVKSLATSLLLCTMWLSNFLMVAVFTTLISVLGLGGTFFAFSLVAGLVSVVSFFVLPETSGLTTEEIQEVFSRGVMHFRSKMVR